jgi:hypothetical protein
MPNTARLMTDRDERPRRGEIHLGDLAWALGSLAWQDQDQAQMIAASLGFGLGITSRQSPLTGIYDHSLQAAQPSPESPPPNSQPVLRRPEPELPPALPASVIPTLLEPLPDLAPASPDPDWSNADARLLDDRGEAPCSRATLFPERASRHIVSAAIATRRSGQAVDIPTLIGALAGRETIRTLPRQLESTLTRGCQVLLDYSATMVPFWEDLTDLIGQVCAVVGAAETRVYSFDTRPTEAARWLPGGKREPWQPDGRPVLAASDLGIQGSAGTVAAHATPDPAWHALAERCVQTRSPLLILIPWPEPRWPRTLAGRPQLVHWSPNTTVGMIRRRVGLGHEVPR